jgi:hypothetical protein
MVQTLALASPPEDVGLCLRIWLLCGRKQRRCHQKVTALLRRHEQLCELYPNPADPQYIPKNARLEYMKKELRDAFDSIKEVKISSYNVFFWCLR